LNLLLTIQPNSFEAMSLLAAVLKEKGELDKAMSMGFKAQQNSPEKFATMIQQMSILNTTRQTKSDDKKS